MGFVDPLKSLKIGKHYPPDSPETIYQIQKYGHPYLRVNLIYANSKWKPSDIRLLMETIDRFNQMILQRPNTNTNNNNDNNNNESNIDNDNEVWNFVSSILGKSVLDCKRRYHYEMSKSKLISQFNSVNNIREKLDQIDQQNDSNLNNDNDVEDNVQKEEKEEVEEVDDDDDDDDDEEEDDEEIANVKSLEMKVAISKMHQMTGNQIVYLLDLAIKYNYRSWIQIAKEMSMKFNHNFYPLDCFKQWRNSYVQSSSINLLTENNFSFESGLDMNLSSSSLKFENLNDNKNNDILPQKRSWTEEEDQLLLDGVRIFGAGSWAKISKSIPNRNRQQCQHRYRQQFSKSKNVLIKGKWSEQEDQLLLKAYDNIFNNTNINPDNESDKIQNEKDVDIKKLSRSKASKWLLVSNIVLTRTSSQCRERYMNILNPQFSRKEWTDKEIKLLNDGILKYGIGRWSLIQHEYLTTRTNDQIRRKYESLFKKKK